MNKGNIRKLGLFSSIAVASVCQVTPVFAHGYHAGYGGGYHAGYNSGAADVLAAEATCGGLLATSCIAASRKAGADIEMVRDQVAEYLVNQQNTAFLQDAMDKFKQELVQQDQSAQNLGFDDLVQLFMRGHQQMQAQCPVNAQSQGQAPVGQQGQQGQAQQQGQMQQGQAQQGQGQAQGQQGQMGQSGQQMQTGQPSGQQGQIRR